MITDTHQHVFWHGRNDAGLIADMDTHGIDLAWLLTWEVPDSATYIDSIVYNRVLDPLRSRSNGIPSGVTLEHVMVAHTKYPGRFLPGYCPDPEHPKAPDLFEAACDIHGVRICGEWKFRMLIDDPRSLELFRAAGRRKAPVVLHLDVPYLGGAHCANWYGGTVDNLARALEACPETIFIGHAPGFWRELSGDAANCPDAYPDGPLVPGGRIGAMLDRYPNLMADLSAGSALRALKRDTGFTSEFLEKYSDRLIFGRDYYGGELLEFLNGLELSPETKTKIFHENARRLVDPDHKPAYPTPLKLG